MSLVLDQLCFVHLVICHADLLRLKNSLSSLQSGLMEVLHLQLNVSFYLTTPSITTTQQPNNARQTPDINCSKNNRWVIRIGYYKHLLSSEIAHKREGGSRWDLFKALAWHTPREKASKIRMKYRREQKRQQMGQRGREAERAGEAGMQRQPWWKWRIFLSLDYQSSICSLFY